MLLVAPEAAFAQDSAAPRDIGLFDSRTSNSRTIVIDEASNPSDPLVPGSIAAGEGGGIIILPDTSPPREKAPPEKMDVIVLPNGELTIQPVGKSAQRPVAPAPAVPVPSERDAINIRETVTTLSPPQAVSVASVEGISAASVGVLTDSEGGLGVELWKGKDAKQIRHALNSTSPKAARSNTMRDLLIRLTLTRALPPEGAGGQDKAVLSARMDLLMRLESYEALTRLMEAVPTPERDAAWYERAVRHQLYRLNFSESCKLTGYAVTRFKAAFWYEQQLFCQAYRKEYDKAAMTLELMREQSMTAPDWLQQLVLAMAKPGGDADKSKGKASYSADAVAMLARGSQELDKDMLAADVWQQTIMLARHPKITQPIKLHAAEQGVVKGALKASALHDLYEGLTFSDAQLATPLTKSEPFASAEGRALAWRISQRIYTVADSATAFEQITQHYRAADKVMLASDVYGKEYRALSRAIFRKHAFYDAAPSFFTVLFANGDLTDARSWLDSAEKGRQKHVLAAGAPLWDAIFTAFAPIETGSYSPTYTTAVDTAIKQLAPSRTLSAEQKQLWQRAGRLFEALGYRLPHHYWPVVLLGDAPVEIPVQTQAAGTKPAALPVKPRDYGAAQPIIGPLKAAVTAKRMGEAVLLMTSVDAHPAHLTDDAVATYVSALLQLGLRREAVALAHESISALLLQGPSGDKS